MSTFRLLLNVVGHKLTAVGSRDVQRVATPHVECNFRPQAPTYHPSKLNPCAKSSARINIIKEKHLFPSSLLSPNTGKLKGKMFMNY